MPLRKLQQLRLFEGALHSLERGLCQQDPSQHGVLQSSFLVASLRWLSGGPSLEARIFATKGIVSRLLILLVGILSGQCQDVNMTCSGQMLPPLSMQSWGRTGRESILLGFL